MQMLYVHVQLAYTNIVHIYLYDVTLSGPWQSMIIIGMLTILGKNFHKTNTREVFTCYGIFVQGALNHRNGNFLLAFFTLSILK